MFWVKPSCGETVGNSDLGRAAQCSGQCVEFTGKALRHLEEFRKFDRNIILDGIKAQLPYEPLRETRNGKMLRPNPLADWELRIRQHRVFYDVDKDADRVRIVAVGYKEHNKLFIGGEEFEL
jgi:mRNA-degrading endonuclease RelE of RelBE toxin-antitoxin system